MKKMRIPISLSIMFIVAISAAAQCGPLGLPASGDAPIGWWSGDGTTLDIVTGLEGTWFGDSGYTQGVAAQAFNFTYYFQWISLSNSNLYNFGTCDFSISVWAKGTDGWGPLASKDDGPGSLNKWIFWVDPNGNLTFHINSPTLGDGVDVVSFNLGYMNPDVWYHFAVTRAGNRYSLYVNG